MEPHRERSQGARGALLGPTLNCCWLDELAEQVLERHAHPIQELLDF